MPRKTVVFATFVALVVTACGGGGGPAGSPSPAGPKIGVVTDIGQLEDKSFNEFSWKGVQDGAKAVGAPDPRVIVT